ncbi:MAG: hypothetical protein HY424_01575 [Candidatus Levybacteria bacterium]|nr:hypothetical protein [Candidatus Levybacteria bacterium]
MKEQLLQTVKRTLLVINSQNFRDPDHRAKVEREHVGATIELFGMGLAHEVIRLRYESNMGLGEPESSDFTPKIVEKFPVGKATAGVDRTQQCVERDLLGRLCVGATNGVVVVREFFRPQNSEDMSLFEVAKRHKGLSGDEGEVIRAIPRHEAEKLIFSGANG